MDLRLHSVAELTDHAPDLLAIPVLDDGEGAAALPPDLPDGLVPGDGAWRDDLRSDAGNRVTVYPSAAGGPRRLVLVGVGCTAADLTTEEVRQFAGRAVRAAEDLRVPSLALLVPRGNGVDVSDAFQAATEGGVLAAWRFRELKTGVGESRAPARITALHLLCGEDEDAEARRGFRRGHVLADAENLARTYQSRPGNVATPTALGVEALRLGEDFGLRVEVLGPDRMEEEGMGALLAVAQGSAQEPRLIILSHDGGAPDEAPLVLVGKGLTFDAGGISIKPAAKMEDMKFDMSGGAAVLAAMTAVARLDVPRNVVGIVPSSENLVGAAAMKPGDVIRTRAGVTVEVINTDAEGRLILADALDYATDLKPEAMVDCATLTGAVVVGLGHNAMAVLGTDDDVVAELRSAGDRSGERCWPLPLWPEYRKQLESETADVKNVGGRPAGTITAAAFLREFVGDVPWGHLDVAGTAYGDGNDLPYRRKGGYGVPTRLLVEWVLGRAGQR